MSIELPRLPFFPRIAGGLAEFAGTFLTWVDQLQIFWQTVVSKVEEHEDTQDAILANLATTDAELTANQAATNAVVADLAQTNDDLTNIGARLTTAEADIDTNTASIDNSTARVTTLEAAAATYVLKDVGDAWVDPTGTPSRATFASYAGQTVSVGYVQAEVQAIDDHVKILSERLTALIQDLTANDVLTE